MSSFIRDQLHQQYAVEIATWLRHAHARRGQAVKRVDLGILPFGFMFAAAELRRLADRARLPAAT